MEISRRCRAPVVATKAVASAASFTVARVDEKNQLKKNAEKNANVDADVDRNARAHKDFLPPKWTSAVTQRLVLEPEPMRGSNGHDRDDSGTETHYPYVGAGDGDVSQKKNFQGRGGFGTSFVARWELPVGRPSARYRVDGEAGIRVVA